MDWNLAIERNREALKRIVASLAAMANLPVLRACGDAVLAGAAAFTFPLWGGRCEASGGGGDPAITPTRRSDDRRPPHKGEVKTEAPVTLPRHLHRAVLRLLRPAEAAARRLVIVAARGLTVPPPAPPRPRKVGSDLKAAHAALRSLGIAIVLPHNIPHPGGPEDGQDKWLAPKAAGEPRRTAYKITLPLLDPLRVPRPGRPRTVPAHAAPRILSFDGPRPHRLPPPPSPNDLIDARRLALRLAALASALDDLPKQALRFARWKARRDAGRIRRVSPLRPGRPPGLSGASRRRPTHEIHEVLADLQYFAFKALEQPDTS